MSKTKKLQPNSTAYTKAILKMIFIIYCLAALFTIRGLRPDIVYGSAVSKQPTTITKWYKIWQGRGGGKLIALINDPSSDYTAIRSIYNSNDALFNAIVLGKSPSRKVEVVIKRSNIINKSVAAIQTGSLFYSLYTAWLIFLIGFGILIFSIYRNSSKFKKLVPKNPLWVFVQIISTFILVTLISSLLF